MELPVISVLGGFLVSSVIEDVGSLNSARAVASRYSSIHIARHIAEPWVGDPWP